MRERWSGRAGFILANIGSAVGLGSIWKFPYEVGANGGSAFVFFYLAGLVLIVWPLMLAEFGIGRRGREDAAGSVMVVAQANGASRHWALVGTFGIATGFLILSFYSVIGGWTIAYTLDMATIGLPGTDPAKLKAKFETLLASPGVMALYHAAFILITGLVVWRGVTHGIEAAAKILMPLLIVLITALAVYSSIEGDLKATLRFLFAFDSEKVTARAALEALGLGFFSIGVGLGLMITYAAYAGESIDLRQVAFVTIATDTAVSFLAGFAIFPIVFANGLDPSSGPGLLFITVPLALAAVPFGRAAAAAFFLLLLVAALSSAISLLELTVAWAEREFGWRRHRATASAAIAVWALGLATVFSFNYWAQWFPLAHLRGFEQATLFDLTDYLTSNLLLPAGGLALSIFAGWYLPDGWFREELRFRRMAAAILRLFLRYIVPAAIAIVTLAPYFT